MNKFKNYPLVDAALRDFDNILLKEVNGMPAGLRSIVTRTLEILSAHISYADDRKEAIMAASVFFSCPSDKIPTAQYFKEKYNDTVLRLVAAAQAENGMARYGEDAFQIFSALTTANNEWLLQQIKKQPQDPQWLESLRRNLEDMVNERQRYDKHILPALSAEENKSIRALFGAIAEAGKPRPQTPPSGPTP